jgi:hypothetical protein
MTAISKPRLGIAIALPLFIFIASAVIASTTKFREHTQQLTLALLADLLLTAPIAYYLVIRKTSVSKLTVLRVFMAGVVLAGVLLSKSNSHVLAIIKTWVSPLVEFSLIGFVVWKFYTANQQLKGSNGQTTDFLIHCRAMLTKVLGSEKIANVFASEISVFYYMFCSRDKKIDYKQKFTGYKNNGIILTLSTFLSLFVIETIGMHFILFLWSKTAAWILTSLSFYTCLQLFAHIKALKARCTMITSTHLLLRNGLMGGDAVVNLQNISKIALTSKFCGEDAVHIAFIKGLENYNIAIYLNAPAVVIKAFGIKKKANVLLVNIDQPKAFMEAVQNAM